METWLEFLKPQRMTLPACLGLIHRRKPQHGPNPGLALLVLTTEHGAKQPWPQVTTTA